MVRGIEVKGKLYNSLYFFSDVEEVMGMSEESFFEVGNYMLMVLSICLGWLIFLAVLSSLCV